MLLFLNFICFEVRLALFEVRLPVLFLRDCIGGVKSFLPVGGWVAMLKLLM